MSFNRRLKLVGIPGVVYQKKVAKTLTGYSMEFIKQFPVKIDKDFNMEFAK